MYVIGQKVARQTGGAPMSTTRFYACPVAMTKVPWVAWLVSLYRRLTNGVCALTDVVPQPTEALMEALDVLDVEWKLVRAALEASSG